MWRNPPPTDCSTRPISLSKKNVALPKYWWLREEALERWEYFFTDKLVYLEESFNRNCDSFVFVPKLHFHSETCWFEAQIARRPEEKSLRRDYRLFRCREVQSGVELAGNGCRGRKHGEPFAYAC